MNLTQALKEFPPGVIHNPSLKMTLPAHGLEELRVKAYRLGTLLVCFDAIDEAYIIAAGEPHLLPQRIERVGDVLMMESQTPLSDSLHGQNQKILIEVHVPTSTRLNVEMFAGVVMLRGGTGDVTVSGKAGEITGVTFAAQVDVHLHAGDVSFNDLLGKANIRVSTGAVTLGWERLSGKEQIEVSCGVGSIDLQLPAGAADKRDFSGLRIDKTLRLPGGTHIRGQVNLGSMDIRHWLHKRGYRASVLI
ncbi:MAG: hypothetical protein U0694_12770 [Anaerolineae bacterium]